MAYSAGNLELNLLGYSDGAVKSIQATVKALNSLSNVINKINNTQFVFAGQKLEHIFTKLASATNSINTTNIQTLASTAKSLNALSKISNLEKMDFAKVGRGFQNLEVAITPFLEKVKSAEASLTSLYGVLSKSTGKKIQNLLTPTSVKSKSSGGFSIFNIGKLTATIYTARRLAQITAKMVQHGVDYTETLNLWSVTMRENIGLASQFVDKMNKAYGVSEQTLMNTQAIFKNMIGSLGQITDDVAYRLSESVTLLALDFASLYNVSVETAFEKFQAMLAGQVRPIRSAGLDITETTLYQFYQEIGGTKTMRQLNRTEKQLLSILAVYKQMGTAGALGDMSKTLGNFANQSRMLNENFKRIATWTGLILEHLLTENEVVVYLNAHLIVIGEILKAIATGMGATKDDNAMTPLFETTEATNEEIDKLQGKLLDFDKFRALSGTENQATSVDTKLLEALTGYSSVIDMANNKAQELATSWIEASGGIEELTKKVKFFGIVLGIVFGVKSLDSIITFIKKIFTLKNAMLLLNIAVMGGAVYAIYEAIQAFKEGNHWAGILYSTIGVALVGAFILLHKKAILSAISSIRVFILNLYVANAIALRSAAGGLLALTGAFIGLGSAIVGAILIFSNWSDMNTWQRVIGIIGVATTAILGLAMAFGVFHSAWSLGLASAGIVAGIGMIVASIATVKKDIQGVGANVSMPDTSTLYNASSMGSAISYSASSSSSISNQSIKNAMYQALVEYGKTGNSTQPIVVYLDGQKVYENTTAHAKKEGRVWSKA